MVFVGGVDEAGRGPVFGPMVLCAYAIEQEREESLGGLGVKDSKLLSEEKRRELYPLVKKLGKHSVVHLSARELTEQMRKRVSLNELEAKAISGLLSIMPSSTKTVFIDSPDPIAANFGKRIKKYGKYSFDLSCEHKADVNHLVVGAASIIAKVERDAAIDSMRELFEGEGLLEPLGSGYSHDPQTVAFLKKHFRNPVVEPFIRHEWETAKRLKTHQVDLGAFL